MNEQECIDVQECVDYLMSQSIIDLACGVAGYRMEVAEGESSEDDACGVMVATIFDFRLSTSNGDCVALLGEAMKEKEGAVVQ